MPEQMRLWRWLVGPAVVAALAVALAACGGGGDGQSADDIIGKIADAVNEPGMVYHAVGDDGSEVWIDAENQVFRRRESTAGGELVSVGQGWNRIYFDALNNEVLEENNEPTGGAPRIDDPMTRWLEPLQALAYGQVVDVIGRTVADGQNVVVLEARTPIVENDEPTGSQLVGRVEVDAETYLPHAFERSETVAPSRTPSQERSRIVYTTSELVPRDDIPVDIFDRTVVEEQVLTTEESLAKLRDLGLTPYWLDRVYESQLGHLELPPKDAVVTDPDATTAELHYALIVGDEENAEPLVDTVIIKLGFDEDTFAPPTLPQFGGELPEFGEEVPVRDGTGSLYTSLLSPADLGCGEEECPESNAKVYRRLDFTLGDTTIQIETYARVSASGDDLDGYNSKDGIRALAETIMELTEDDS